AGGGAGTTGPEDRRRRNEAAGMAASRSCRWWGAAETLLTALALRLVLDLDRLVAVVGAAVRADLVGHLVLAAARAAHQLRRLHRVRHPAHALPGPRDALLRYRSHRRPPLLQLTLPYPVAGLTSPRRATRRRACP